MNETCNKPRISLVIAMDRHGAIGLNGDLPWRQRADLQYFKRTTMSKPILMGRRTHDSIGRALPGRHNIILTRDRNYRAAPDCTVAHDLDDALTLAGSEEIMVIGGADLFAMALPMAERIYLTELDAEVEADTFFPAFNRDEWREISRQSHPADEHNEYPYSFVELVRV